MPSTGGQKAASRHHFSDNTPSASTAKVSVLQLDLFHDLHPSIAIEMVGSYTARHVESGLTVDLTSSRNRSRTKGAISALCRKLIDHGHDPEARAHIIRYIPGGDDPMPIFKRNRSLRAWAEVDCIETEKTSAYVVKYQPFPRHL